eukprot:419134_1
MSRKGALTDDEEPKDITEPVTISNNTIQSDYGRGYGQVCDGQGDGQGISGIDSQAGYTGTPFGPSENLAAIYDNENNKEPYITHVCAEKCKKKQKLCSWTIFKIERRE